MAAMIGVSPWRCSARALLLTVFMNSAAAAPGAETTPSPVPSTATLTKWITEITAQGERRPGYPADQWVEQWARDRFRAFGLQQVHLEPVTVQRWMPKRWSLRVWHRDRPGESLPLPSYPVPMSAAAQLEGELVLASGDAAKDPSGRIAVVNTRLLSMPQSRMRKRARWHYDPDGEFDTLVQTLPMSERFQKLMEPEIAAGAIGFIGILDFPWETDRYFNPYDGKARPIPGLWLSAEHGQRLVDFMAQGPTQARIELERELTSATSYNVIGTLPGRSQHWIVIGSHHDGPWPSAVEDASGIALVLAQARYWSQRPRAQRPFNLMFVLQGGHMSGGAGLIAFTQKHRTFLERQVVAELHLEHAAREARVVDGRLLPGDEPEVRWWFTSGVPVLERAVATAICAERLERSLMLPPEGFPHAGDRHPPTDAAFFHPLVPIVSFLTAPMYLFDERDRPDMVHEASLVPLTRAIISIIMQLDGNTAAGMRQQRYQTPEQAPPPCMPVAK